MPRLVVLRGVRDAKEAIWQSTGTYGTVRDISAIRQANMELELDTDQQEGDDEIIDRYSRVIGATISLQQARVDLQVASDFSGGTFETGADYDEFLLDGENDPNFVGLAFKVVASDGKEAHYFFPKCKLSGNLSLEAGYGAYTVPSAEFQAIKDGAAGTMLWRIFDSATALDIPLATTVDA
jgi:hypothetical protein